MRHALVLGWTLLVSAAAAGADRPIPQDAARMEKQARERLEWHRRTLEREYDRVGKKDARWDQPARKALDLAARMFAQQFEPMIRLEALHAAARTAVDAGCDDPMIRYLFIRTSPATDFPTPFEHDRQLLTIAEALAASSYSPYRRAVATEIACDVRVRRPKLNPEGRPALQRKLDAALDLLPKSLAEDPRDGYWEVVWYREINDLIAIQRRLSGDYKRAFDHVDARLAPIKGIEALRLAIKGNFLILWGWEARTSQVAANVTEDQFRAFAERLQEARETLTKAWKVRPDEPHVPGLMLILEKGIGQGDRETMETWFERALTLDGNNQEACWQKLDWLDPKWYGGDSYDPMIAFGRACAATKNWHNGITLLVAEAHFRRWATLPQQERVPYMRSPEVWNEIRSVYLEYLKHVPDNAAERTRFAMICYLGAHYPMAHAQFQAIGDRLTMWPGAPRISLEEIKKARDFTAEVMAKHARGPGA